MKPISFCSLLLTAHFGSNVIAQSKGDRIRSGEIVPQTMPVPQARPSSNAASWAVPPKLVVGIVVDQMRVDYLYRYWGNFGDGGFKRLIGGGAFLRNAHYNYVPTITGPGHASIYTGSTPSHHGIVANDRYDRATRKTIYCVEDNAVSGVGAQGAIGQRSPVQLLATTLSDEIERRTDRQGHTVGVALKDRSAILPIGRTGDAAFWFDPATGGFTSSTWYMKELPKWASDFNSRGLTAKYLKGEWEPVLPIERYHQVLPDANPYEQLLAAGVNATFPIDLSQMARASGNAAIMTTPMGNTLTTDMALAALDGEGMGRDAITDLLAISYSSTDILAHKTGPRAVEVEDMYVRLDRELERLLNELDKRVGQNAYTLFLTADHGAVDVPAYLKDLRGSAGYVDGKDLQRRIVAVAEGVRVDSVLDGQVFLEPNPRRDAARAIAERMAQFPEIDRAVIASDLMRADGGARNGDPLVNGFMPQRCGDILYTLKPGFMEAEGVFVGKGTSHSSGWNYDTHIPVLFYGQGVQHAEVVRRTSITDMVPTIAMIIGCALPDAATGEPVQEVLRVR